MAGETSAAALGAVRYALEATPGTYAASNFHWLFPLTNDLHAPPDMLKKKVMSGSRASGRINKPMKFQPGGTLTYELYPTMGAAILPAALGAEAPYLTALTADTVKTATPITTTAGQSTITVTNTGTVSYTQGAWLKVNTGVLSEERQIQTISGNGALGTILTVAALIGNAAAAAGTAVQQVGQHKLTTAPAGATIPSLSIESQEGVEYAEKYAGCLVDKLNIKADKDDIVVSTTVYGTKMPVRLATPTTPAPSAAELADMDNPFTITNNVLATYGDNTASGTSTMQFVTGAESVSISWSNGLVKKAAHDLSQVYRAFPGEQELKIQYSYFNEAKRPAEWEDYLAQLAGTSVPFAFGSAINLANTGADNWRAVGFFVPSATYGPIVPVRALGDIIGMTVEMEAVSRTAQGDLMQCFVVNSDSTVYAAG